MADILYNCKSALGLQLVTFEIKITSSNTADLLKGPFFLVNLLDLKVGHPLA